jgi:glycosyltransferase involved in cell wall biosynthesis
MSTPALFPVKVQVRAQAARAQVLFVIPGDGKCASMIFSRRQAEALAAEGVEVRTFYLASRTSPRVVAAEFQRFRAELAKRKPSVVHAHFGTVTALFCALGCGGVPLVITYRGSDLNAPPASFRWIDKVRAHCGRLFSQLAALRAQQIVCVSAPLREALWWRAEGAVVLPSGVDPAVFRPAPRLLARKRLGWSPAPPVVLFNAGRDPRVKRLDLARAAVEFARRRVPDLRMEVLDGHVHPEKVPDMMNAADCLLLTSVSEGSPTVVQEALASNLPVVSVAVGDVVERLRGVRDSAIAAADATALGDALVNLLSPPRRSNGSLKLREFSAAAIARALKGIYEGLA